MYNILYQINRPILIILTIVFLILEGLVRMTCGTIKFVTNTTLDLITCLLIGPGIVLLYYANYYVWLMKVSGNQKEDIQTDSFQIIRRARKYTKVDVDY
jgi:hypothetical protein